MTPTYRKIVSVLLAAMCAVAQEPTLRLEEPRRTPRFRPVTHVVTFPPPNECVILKVAAANEIEALYVAVSRGGFSLKRSDGGLSVWSIGDWARAQRSWPDHCGDADAKGPQ